LVGGALVERLLSAGFEVRALARSRQAADHMAAVGAIPVDGDVFAAGTMRDAMTGCATVFHVAGVNDTCPRDAAPMYRVNVDGTRIVVGAAAAAGVRRVVVTSSAAAIGEPPGGLADERTPHSGVFLSHYARSKKLGEDAAFEEGIRRGVEVVAVNPVSVQGPGRAGGSARLLLHALRRRHPVLLRSAVSLVDIADCTDGHLLAAERGEPGERYLLSGSSGRTTVLIAVIAEVTGNESRPLYIPRWLVASVGVGGAAAARLLMRNSELCPELLRTLLHGHRFDGSQAERSLGVRYTPIEDTIARAVTWYREQGLLGVS